MAATDDFALKRNVATSAVHTADNFRFSQLVESTKDVFIEELRSYFSTPAVGAARFAEILTIEKYAIKASGTDPFETLVTMMREYPDALQKLPLIAITKASGNRFPIGITGAFVDHVQYVPRLRSTAEPFDLTGILNPASPPQLAFVTKPDTVNERRSSMSLVSAFFPNPAAVTAEQLARAINFQALYARARAVTSGGSTYLEIMPGGPIRTTVPNRYPTQITYFSGEPQTPGYIRIDGASTAALLTELGFTVGQSDSSDNSSRPPMNRYGTSARFTIGLDVGATSDNERTELTDLIIHWLNIYLADKDFTFYGQHVFEEPESGATTERYFQIVLGDWSAAGEADVGREGGEREDKVYANRFTIPVVVFDYIDRIVPAALFPARVFVNSECFVANQQPSNITGVMLRSFSSDTSAGAGTLTCVAGAATTLRWQAPTESAPGAAVDVSAGGVFTLVGGAGGSTVAVEVSATGLPTVSAAQPIAVTGVRILTTGNTNAAGNGTLAFTIVGADRFLQWNPPGAEAAGAAVDVSLNGTYALLGAGGSSLQVQVTATVLPLTNTSETVAVTTTFSDSITLVREVLPEAS